VLNRRHYYVYRQWSWYNRREVKIVEGGTTDPADTSTFEVESAFKQYVHGLITQKDYILASVKYDPLGDAHLEATIERFATSIQQIVDQNQQPKPREIAPPNVLPVEKPSNDSLSMRFKRAQAERQKKTKW
jgi:hypothetical protein